VDASALRALVAENIRAVAKQKKMTINRLADFATVSRAQMFNVLAGTSSATTDWLAKVAETLEVHPSQLLAPRLEREATAAKPAPRPSARDRKKRKPTPGRVRRPTDSTRRKRLRRA